MRAGLSTLIDDKDHVASLDPAITQSGDSVVLIVEDLGSAAELMQLGRNSGLLDESALGHQVALAQDQTAIVVQRLRQGVNNLLIVVDSTFDILTQGLAGKSSSPEATVAPDSTVRHPQRSFSPQNTGFITAPITPAQAEESPMENPFFSANQ